MSEFAYYSVGLVAVTLALLGFAYYFGAKEYLKRWGFHRLQRLFGPPEGTPQPDRAPNPASTTSYSGPRPTANERPAAPPTTAAGPTGLISQLPDPVADFVGRQDQIEKITACLRHSRGAAISAALGTIGGQGGVGKTELAYYVAREVRDHYPDGQVQINLRGLDAEPATWSEAMRDVLLRFAPDQQLPDDDQHLAELYQGLLAERRVLILADNVKDSAQVDRLVPKPPSALLVTSRQSIPLPGVEPVNLDQLAPDEAAKLLRENVAEDRASDDEIARLAELCGYLPLALRAAGERLAGAKTLSTAAYIEKLERDRGDLRYQGKQVMAVLAGSVEALAQEQPELVEKWRSLAVFPAPFDRPAAEAVGELDADELEVLVSRNLVLFDEKEERFRLHDLFRDLAREGLSDENEYAAAKRHAGYFLRVAGAAHDRYLEGDEGVLDGLQLFDRERAHIETGQAWAAAHAQDDDQAALLTQDYPLRAAYISDLRQQARDRIAWLETSTQAARKLGNKKQEGLALGNLGNIYVQLGEMRKAIEYYEQHLAIARETGDRRGEGRALGNLGVAYRGLGETRKAIEYYEQRLAFARETGDRRGEGNALHNRAEALDELGRRQEAIADAQAALAICEEIEDPTIDQTRQLLKRWGALPDP